MKKIFALTAAVSMLGATAAVSQTTNQTQQPQTTPQMTQPQQQTAPPVGVPPSPQAQTPGSTTTTTPMKQAPGQQAFLNQQQSDQMLASNLIGKNILDKNNARIGEINDLLISQDGQVAAALVGVGGFLGIGEKTVAIPYDALNRSPQSDQLTVSYTRQDLEQAPQFVTAERKGSSTTGKSGTSGAGGTQR